ncbi:MAG: Peptidyl-tRNA hydrolase [Candidatus Falkowbacteria bacterium GW2011_GWA2_39_24]|uniref:Peptidyl-tRNA hydrolase n=1 Tax=Candidatus Falkowbacteria bacterium GW2011_GWA2_39_24 TaxID=1618634 RepID=A0A0G0NCU0_9BACT|nr:MAG: Peptidyl-tRNA hydrolase [Candidatus Falkowbacteria bacterium GW2011_GWA2_39_24]
MKIIVGLGNPGKKYDQARHNLGFAVIDQLATRTGETWQENKKFKAEIIQTTDYFLVKPLTFMNNSGEAVRAILNYYDLLTVNEAGEAMANSDLSEILTVIHDELDLPLGKYKISINSSAAGHRGVQSIIDHLQTQNFTRLRIGIATNKLDKIPSDVFVQKKFSRDEQKIVDNLMPQLLANF